ncbi:tripartite-type tricarboxylate transporter receptor subunit TctC [Variovorax paradoxus]|uniref:Bug family tripartite tricarboxylate transporter substrate binding protein n=1 Tax=Variovorax paradoxus TaxID=34073 RepID=UPI00278DF24C|nr:tripartite tricarboxylate transporter substrate binding protein [Variovorax paradoxus]MDQ0571087.1 tripartite-type tricarboxylate transporter receptor subunit TctC [Variovorax paradoxus]
MKRAWKAPAVALGIAVGASMGASAQPAASAADFPNRPIRIVVPFAAGGATDVIARVVGQKVSEQLGQPVVVENKAGANGNIGAVSVARAAPDGYTVLMATSSHAINATLYRKLDYRLTTDFAALSNLASVPLVLVVHPSLPARTPAELASHAKSNDGKVNFASGGTGTAAHLAGEQFNTLAGVRMMHVPYKGGALAQNDLVGGQVQAMFANLPEALAQVQAGRLRPLAVTGGTRRANLPDVPTFAEAGYPKLDARSWFGLFAPAATPAPVVARLSSAIARAVADPAVQARLKELGADPVGDQHEAFQKFVGQEVTRWGALVERSGATVD